MNPDSVLIRFVGHELTVPISLSCLPHTACAATSMDPVVKIHDTCGLLGSDSIKSEWKMTSNHISSLIIRSVSDQGSAISLEAPLTVLPVSSPV